MMLLPCKNYATLKTKLPNHTVRQHARLSALVTWQREAQPPVTSRSPPHNCCHAANCATQWLFSASHTCGSLAFWFHRLYYGLCRILGYIFTGFEKPLDSSC